MKPLFIILSLLLAAGTSFSQHSGVAPAISEIAEAYLAKKDENGKAGERAEVFFTNDIPIFCVVRLAAPAVATVRIDLVAANVSGVKSDSKVVSVSYGLKDGEDRVNFSGKPHGLWVAGKYRIDIFIGDRRVGKINFDIIKQPVNAGKPSKRRPSVTSKNLLKQNFSIN